MPQSADLNATTPEKHVSTDMTVNAGFTTDTVLSAPWNQTAKMELLIEELSNSKDGVLLEYLNRYPILSTKAHKSPFDNQWLNLLAGIIVPIGLFFYFRIWRFSIRLDKDLKNIIKTNREIQERINNKSFIIWLWKN